MPLLNGDPVSFKLEDYISMDERGLKGKQDFLRVILAGQKGRLNEEDGTTEVAGQDLPGPVAAAYAGGDCRIFPPSQHDVSGDEPGHSRRQCSGI